MRRYVFIASVSGDADALGAKPAIERRSPLGTVVVTIGVGDPQGQRFENLEVVVDTGATFSTVPRALLERLGVPVERSAQSELADGSVAPVDVGRTIIRVEERERTFGLWACLGYNGGVDSQIQEW